MDPQKSKGSNTLVDWSAERMGIYMVLLIPMLVSILPVLYWLPYWFLVSFQCGAVRKSHTWAKDLFVVTSSLINFNLCLKSYVVIKSIFVKPDLNPRLKAAVSIILANFLSVVQLAFSSLISVSTHERSVVIARHAVSANKKILLSD